MQDADFRDLLQRAEEIQAQSGVQLELNPELAQLVAAAEEAGLEKEAVLQALRERISTSGKALEPGDLVFAPSSDEHFYVAKVLSKSGAQVKLQFLNGGEAHLDASTLRPFTVLPGQTLCCPWPSWGWWNCKVVGYDNVNQKVKVSDGWTQEMTFHISDVRINNTKPMPGRTKQILTNLAWALGGSAIGALVMRLILR